jgi:acyl carrier protein
MGNIQEDAHSDNEETEAILAKIWAEVLDTNSVDINTDFLELGGDSLSVVLCISRVRTTLGFELAFEDFFFGQATITKFASVIRQQTRRELDLPSRAG